MIQPMVCGTFYPLSPCPTPIASVTHAPPTPPPWATASTGANIGEPVAALGLFLAVGAAAIWSAHKRKGSA